MGKRSAITDARARTFKVPPGREAVLWDGVGSGLGVRALPSGRKTWFVQRRIGSGFVKRTLSATDAMSVEEARRAARALIEDTRRGEDALVLAPTMRTFGPAFLADCAGRWKPSTRAAHAHNMQRFILPAFGNRCVDAITARDVRSWFDDLSDPAECVADKGYHSRAVLRALNDSPWKTRIAAPKQTGFSRWHGDEAARRAVTNNRARLKSGVAREAFKLRAEIVERCFAHNLDRGGMRRTWLRGRENVHKRYLLHVAGHNLSLLMRQLIGARHPAGGRGGRIWRYFRSAHAHRGHAGGTGGLAKRPDGFRRRIPHLGVRAGKSYLINGLIVHPGT